jgi:hypothetical protein
MVEELLLVRIKALALRFMLDNSAKLFPASHHQQPSPFQQRWCVSVDVLLLLKLFFPWKRKARQAATHFRKCISHY